MLNKRLKFGALYLRIRRNRGFCVGLFYLVAPCTVHSAIDTDVHRRDTTPPSPRHATHAERRSVSSLYPYP